jgi:hypothetical protein
LLWRWRLTGGFCSFDEQPKVTGGTPAPRESSPFDGPLTW